MHMNIRGRSMSGRHCYYISSRRHEGRTFPSSAQELKVLRCCAAMVGVAVNTSWTLQSVGFSRLNGGMALGPSQRGSFVLSPLPHITQGFPHTGPQNTQQRPFIQSQSGLALSAPLYSAPTS